LRLPSSAARLASSSCLACSHTPGSGGGAVVGVEVTRSPPLPQNRHQRASLLPQHEADTQHSPQDEL
jgi:hypothetical protein